MKDMDNTLKAMPEARSRKAKESAFTLNTDLDSFEPGSSPESAATGLSRRDGSVPTTPDVSTSVGSLRSTSSSVPTGRRAAGLPVSSRYLSPRSVSGSSTTSTPRTSFSSSTPRASSRLGSISQTPASAPAPNRPRWSASTVVDYNQYGPHKRPDRRLYRSGNSSSATLYSSSLPHSPLSREQTASPSPNSRRMSTSPARTATSNTNSASASASGTLEARPRQYKPSHLVQEKLGMIPKEDRNAPSSGRVSAAGSRAGSRLGKHASLLPLHKSKDKDDGRPKWRP